MFVIDPHLHSCLSPCAVLDMHPAGLIDAAICAGLDAVAVCDHNSAGNVAAVERAELSIPNSLSRVFLMKICRK